jgi:hypothetical protein
MTDKQGIYCNKNCLNTMNPSVSLFKIKSHQHHPRFFRYLGLHMKDRGYPGTAVIVLTWCVVLSVCITFPTWLPPYVPSNFVCLVF